MSNYIKHEAQANASQETPSIRLIAWEVTRACNLACKHCRAESRLEPYPEELSTEEAMGLIDSFPKTGNPIVIFTGGEPLLRKDIFDLIRYTKDKGLRCVIAPNGTLLSSENVKKLKNTGIERVSVSIDGPDAESHNQFRGVPGAFEASLQGIENLKKQDLPFQINTTVTRDNLKNFKEIFSLAESLGAVAWHIFLLVPTGRASSITQEVISAQEYENVLNWFYDFRKLTNMHLKATCAPQYHRILRQRAQEEGIAVNYSNFGLDAISKGCLGGISFCFISHSGQVQPCGYLNLNCGNIRERSLPEIWSKSSYLNELRNRELYQGKCGICEYHNVCGGCRARALTMNGHYLAEEPLCLYQPMKNKLVT